MRTGFGVLSAVAPDTAAAAAEQLFLTPRRFTRPAFEREVLEGARRISLGRPHGDLAAWEWGAGAPAVLLVHGWEGRGAQLAGFVAPLVAKGLGVITFDARGHGDSGGHRSSLVHFADVVAHVAATRGPLRAIVSHSMGGAATLWASRRGVLAERLALIAPPIDLRDFTREFSRMVGLSSTVRHRVHTRLERRFGVPVEAFRADVVARTLPSPVLVVHDERDREVPIACGEAIARASSNAELVRTSGLGHHRILRDAGVQAVVTSFVTAVS